MDKKTAGEQMREFAVSNWMPEQEDIMSMADRLAREREERSDGELEQELTTLRAQLKKTNVAVERVRLQDRIEQLEKALNHEASDAE